MRTLIRFVSFTIVFLAILLTSCEREVQSEARIAWVDAERILNADSEPGNWLAHGRTFDEQRFSPLDQINVDTVGDLELAWYVILKGALLDNGMPPWSEVLSSEDAEAIRAFIVFMANQ